MFKKLNCNLFKTYRQYHKNYPMASWHIWQFFSVFLPLVYYSTFVYALVWSEVKGYNRVREVAILNVTGEDKRFMNEWKYLRRWDHMVQLFFWFISVIVSFQKVIQFKDYRSNDQVVSIELIKKLNNRTRIQQFQDNIYHALAHPLAIVVTLMYWSLKLYNPDLLSGGGSKVPSSPAILDHIVHTLVSLACFTEFFLTYHKRPVWYMNIIGPLILLVTWVLFDEWLKAYKGFAVYNVLNTPLYTLVVSLIAVAIVVIICFCFEKLHYFYWTERRIDNFQLSPKLRNINSKNNQA